MVQVFGYINDGTDQSGNKLRTYRKYKTTFEAEHYVKTIMCRGQRKVIDKLRSCNLSFIYIY